MTPSVCAAVTVTFCRFWGFLDENFLLVQISRPQMIEGSPLNDIHVAHFFSVLGRLYPHSIFLITDNLIYTTVEVV